MKESSLEILDGGDGAMFNALWVCKPRSAMAIVLRGYFYQHSSSMPVLRVYSRKWPIRGSQFPALVPQGLDIVGYYKWLETIGE